MPPRVTAKHPRETLITHKSKHRAGVLESEVTIPNQCLTTQEGRGPMPSESWHRVNEIQETRSSTQHQGRSFQWQRATPTGRGQDRVAREQETASGGHLGGLLSAEGQRAQNRGKGQSRKSLPEWQRQEGSKQDSATPGSGGEQVRADCEVEGHTRQLTGELWNRGAQLHNLLKHYFMLLLNLAWKWESRPELY